MKDPKQDPYDFVSVLVVLSFEQMCLNCYCRIPRRTMEVYIRPLPLTSSENPVPPSHSTSKVGHCHSIVLCQIAFDARDLRPDMLSFPCFFSVGIYVFILWRHSSSVNFVMKNQGKTEHVWSIPLASNVIGKMTIFVCFLKLTILIYFMTFDF